MLTEDRRPARDFYRLAWRNMAANTGERTLIPAIIPPGAAHIHGISSVGGPAISVRTLAGVAGFVSSLMADFFVRTAPKSTISATTIGRLPYVDGLLAPCVVLRSLRLNCATDAYGDLWRECYSAEFREDDWTGGLAHARRRPLGGVGLEWGADTLLRIAADRRQALLEIDALVALMLGLTADELCTIYRTQFPVLYGYDRNRDHYDANGRLVPHSVLTVWRKRGDRITEEERTATNQAGNTYAYEPPFVTLDREADMRQAYTHFERVLAERS
jgi:hypothetical protein